MIKDVFIGLGSNLNDPSWQLKQALVAIGSLPASNLVQCSSFYKSKAWGPIQDQPDFVNAVAKLQTTLSPLTLFHELKLIEQNQGRNVNGERWGPRCLDLDILLYGCETISENNLKIPHLHLAERDFVLYPLFELAPNLVMPNGISLQELIKNCPSHLELLVEEHI